jgi:nucleoside-diphosphate-sugar epimerase
MDIFVTGATGFVGSAVAAAFARQGHTVFGLARSKDKAARLERHEITPVIGDLDDPKTYASAADRCSVLVHCAAELSARYMELDKLTVKTLVSSAARSNQPRTILYTSGVWVYGDTEGRLVDENAALNPPALVAPRVQTEKEVLAASEGRVRTIVIRPGCVYGRSGSLTSTWFESASKEGAAHYVGDGSQRWAMVHLMDLADAYVRAAESSSGGEAFNVVDRSRFTVRECAEAASRAAGASGKTKSVPVAEAAKAYGPMAECLALNQNVDGSKCARVLGWQPRHGGFVDGVERYYLAWRAAGTT